MKLHNVAVVAVVALGAPLAQAQDPAAAVAPATDLLARLQGPWRQVGEETVLVFEQDRCVLAHGGRQTVYLVEVKGEVAVRHVAYSGLPAGDRLWLDGDELVVLWPGGVQHRHRRLDAVPASASLEPFALGTREPDEAERAELLEELADRMALDQDIRVELQRFLGSGVDPSSDPAAQALVEEMGAIDAENTARLRELLPDIGWISRERFGADANLAAFLIVQHSGDLALMRTVLPLLEKRARAEPAFGQNYALLYDRTSLALGGTQRYGSQGFPGPDGRTIIGRLEDPETVDERRAAFQMGTLADYAALLGAELPPDYPR